MAVRPAYFLREAGTNLRRNILMFVAAVLAVSISLTLLGAVLYMMQIVDNVTRQWQNDVVMNVFLKDDAAQNATQVKTINEEISSYKEVKEVTFVSKQEAFDEFRDMFSNQPELVESVTPETLPASFRVSLVDNSTLETVQDRIRTISGVDEVNSALEEVKKFQTFLTVIQWGVGAAGLILLAAAVVLVSNTIRLAIFARRKEIAIMKLVGATNWFIRWPFLLEGFVAGAAGALIAILLLWGGWAVIASGLSNTLGQILPLGIPWGWQLLTLVGLFFVAVGISAGGTVWALNKHLDV